MLSVVPDRAHPLQVCVKAFPRSILSSPVPSLFFPQEEEKNQHKELTCPRTVCVILLSQFTKQKHSVSLDLIRKLARRPGWSGFSYTGVRHTLSFSSSQPHWLTEGRENSSGAFPCPNTLPSAEQGTVSCFGAQTGHPWTPAFLGPSFQWRELHLVAVTYQYSF